VTRSPLEVEVERLVAKGGTLLYMDDERATVQVRTDPTTASVFFGVLTTLLLSLVVGALIAAVLQTSEVALLIAAPVFIVGLYRVLRRPNRRHELWLEDGEVRRRID
jgi:hypothetical protein